MQYVKLLNMYYFYPIYFNNNIIINTKQKLKKI